MDAVRVLRSGMMPTDGVSHGFLTREGGVSEGPFRSLNCGFGSNDVRAHIAENRRRAVTAVGLQDAPLITPIQVHGTRVLVIVDSAGQPEKADAIVTRIPRIAIGILTADCAPVLLVDPQARVLGAAHAGWKGAVDGVLQQTVAAMEAIGAKRERIVAAVGPSIAQASYEVDPPFAEPFLQQDPEHKSLFHRSGKKLLFDLSGYAVRQLALTGVTEVDVLDCDTAGEPNRFFSYRRNLRSDEKRYGRLLSVIGMRP